jgi:hypothetical protein
MKQLLKALEIRKKYNAMPFDEFIAEYENYFNVKVPKEVKEKFQNIGLNNVDFITSEYLKYYIPSKEE